jgi:hypothetical protein
MCSFVWNRIFIQNIMNCYIVGMLTFVQSNFANDN